MFALAVPGTIAKAATNNNASAETIARADRCIHPPRPRRGRWVYEITGAPRNVHADSEHSSARGEPMPGFIKTEMEDRLAIITVNRPDALNALNSTVLRELSMAIEHLSMAADVGAIILTGAGDRAFVAGADIKEMANLSGLEMQRFSEMGRRLGDAMASCNKPIIAAINGFALGGGCELALACDIVGSTDDKKEGMRAFIEKRKPAWTGA